MEENEKKCPNFRASKAFRDLKKSLLDSLTARGLVEEVYRDKVSEYMDLWVLHRTLKHDIAIRGVSVIDDRGRISENRSISLAIQTSRQMLSIFTTLGFREEAAKGGGVVDDEL